MKRVLLAVAVSSILSAAPAIASPPLELERLPAITAVGSIPDMAAAVSLAQAEAPAPEVSAAPNILDQLLTPGGIATLVAVLGTVLGLLLGSSAIRKRRVALATYHAFHIVEDIDSERGDGTLDKVVAGLRAADEYMRANGWRPLKPGEQAVAKLGFQSLNGEQKESAKIHAKAIARVAGAASPQ